MFLEKDRFVLNKYGNYSSNCEYPCFPNKIDADDLCQLDCFYPLFSTETHTGLKNTIDEIFSNEDGSPKKESEEPIFIIGFGPPGSGKSRVVDEVGKIYSNINWSNTIDTNVDFVFQNTKQWKRQSQEIQEMDVSQEKKKEYSQKLYTTYRYFSDQISDLVLYKALGENYNLYFETTGFSVDWLLNLAKHIKNLGYTLVCVYPFVKTEIIRERLIKRQHQTGQEPKPYDAVIANAKSALINFVHLRDTHVFDNLILLDNNDVHPQILIKYRLTKSGEYEHQCSDVSIGRFISEVESLLGEEEATKVIEMVSCEMRET